jgi:hypothetical protein
VELPPQATNAMIATAQSALLHNFIRLAPRVPSLLWQAPLINSAGPQVISIGGLTIPGCTFC